MSDLPKPITQGRQNFNSTLTAEQLRSLAADPTLRVLQTCVPTEAKTWELLNNLLLPVRPDVELRVYGFYSSTCDLTFLKQLPNLINFSADCLMNATGIESIGTLTKLQSLSIGIFSLESFDFLENLPNQSLRKLALLATRSKRPDLALIKRFPNLRTLYIEGQQKNIEAIATLNQLEDLTLRSVSPKELTFLRSLEKLWSLDIKLGGITNLHALEGLEQIKYLELWQVKGLSNIDVIASLTGLQNLYIQSLKNVTALPDMSRLIKLRRLYLENMKGLKDLSSLTTAPALQEFVHVMSINALSDYEKLFKMSSLEKASAWFGSKKKNDAFSKLAAKHNIAEYKFSEFIYS